MTSINISVKKEAYNFLKDMKTRDKSFSDIILSFKKEQSSVMRFFGALKEADWKEFTISLYVSRGIDDTRTQPNTTDPSEKGATRP